jgi:hypothetical protein
MAPLPSSSLKNYLTTLLKRTPSPSPSPSPTSSLLIARTGALAPRDTLVDPSSGVTPLQSIPNKAIFALFGIIGVGIVCTAIWFFFWAKNGGFYFKETDWDDYKSTVLRRKGPNGTTLSGATESTDLGGGSVVHGEKSGRSKWGRKKKGMKRYKDFEEEGSEMTGSAGGSSLGSEMSELKWKIKKDRKKAKRESRLRGGDLGAEHPMLDDNETVENELRAYRHEKPARVGGINKQPDGSAWDGSTNDAASELLSNREHTPTNTPTKIKKERNDNYTGGTAGIRKVVSSGGGGFWNRGSNTAKKNAEEERIKAEAKKLQDKGRAAQRRDFSFNAGDDSTVASGEEERQARREAREARRASRSPTKKVPGSYIYEGSEVGSAVSSNLGTKAYHHPIPGLSSTAGSEYAEEKRRKRNAGYRRGRRDSLSDDGN